MEVLIKTTIHLLTIKDIKNISAVIALPLLF